MKTMLSIEKESFKRFVLLYLESMKDLQREVLVYRGAVEVLKKTARPDDAIERLVEGIRKRPEVEKVLDEMYTRFRDEALAHIETGSLDLALSQFLREWKAKGPIN